MPDSFAESADGVVLIANGVDPMVRWDGFSQIARPAGVRPPPAGSAPVVSGAGSGGLSGTYVVYVRFVDAAGNVSNLSDPSPRVTLAGNDHFVYSNLAVPADAVVVRRQVLRNTDGQLSTFYVDLDTTDISSTELTSTTTDAELAAGEAVPLLDEDGLPFANRYTVPPDSKPFLAFHLNRMWAAGSVTYAEGSVQVTQGSSTVTGIGTRWPSTWANRRYLYVQGAPKPYFVTAVDQDLQTLVIEEQYGGPTDKFAAYGIQPPPGEVPVLYFSEPNLPEAWPATNGLSLPEDGDTVTGLINYDSFLYVLKRYRMYRVSAQSDPRKDGFIFFSMRRGCVNHRCAIVVEEKLYLLDESGVYRTDGGGEGENLSTPIQNLFRKDEPGAIDFATGRYFHAAYDPSGEVIRWYVTLRGDYLPRQALCLAYKTGRWWTEDLPTPAGASCLGRIGRFTGGWADGNQQPFLGGVAGSIMALGGTLDGVPADGPTTRGTVTSAGTDSLTDARAAFDATWANVPVVLVSGRGAGQLRVVVAATATTLRLDEPWAVAPDATTVYQVGGIRFRYTGGRLRYAPAEKNEGASVELQYVPTAAGPLYQRFDLRLYQDFSATPRRLGRSVGLGQRPTVSGERDGLGYVVDLSDAAGTVWQRFDRKREMSVQAPRYFRLQLAGVSGPEQVRFGECVLNGMVK